MKNIIKIKTFGFENNYTRYEKNFGDKIVYLKKIYKFTADHFLIRHVIFVSIVKSVIKNKKFHFVPNLCDTKRILIKKICPLRGHILIARLARSSLRSQV